MKKLLLSILLCTAVTAVAEPTYFEYGGLKYQYIDGVKDYLGGNYTLVPGSGFVQVPKSGNVCILAANPDYSGTELVIPATVRYNDSDINVVGIAAGAFKGNQTITSVSFPATFPDSRDQYYDGDKKSRVDLMGAASFAGCTNLTKVVFAEGMKKFYGGHIDAPFKDCPIAEVVIPRTLTEFDKFLEESAVETIDIPEWVTTISFRDCKKLKEVPELLGMTTVPSYCFLGCESLTMAVTPVNATLLGSGCFDNCKNLETLVISDNVEIIGINAITNCVNLKNVIIGAGVKKMGVGCFKGCTAIETFIFKPATPPGLENTGAPTATEATADFFPENVYANATVYVPDGSLNAYNKKGWFTFDKAYERNTSGIGLIFNEGSDCHAEYYDLRGVRVDAGALVPGIYIRRQGGSVTKIRIR